MNLGGDIDPAAIVREHARAWAPDVAQALDSSPLRAEIVLYALASLLEDPVLGTADRHSLLSDLTKLSDPRRLSVLRSFLASRFAGSGLPVIAALDRAVDGIQRTASISPDSVQGIGSARPRVLRHVTAALLPNSLEEMATLDGRVADEARRLLEGNWACLHYRVDSDRQECAAQSPSSSQRRPTRTPLNEGLTGQVFSSQNATLAPPKAPDEPWSLAVPLRIGGEVTGVLLVRRSSKLSDEDEQLLQAFADRSAVAVEFARKMRESERRRQELEAVHAVAVVAASREALDVALHLVAERVRELLNADGAIVELLNSNRRHLQVVATAGDVALAWQNHERPAGSGASSLVLRAGRSYVVRSVSGRDGPEAFLNTMIWRAPVESVAAVPLSHRGRVLGILSTLGLEPYRFDETDLSILESFSASAALAIENARLYEEAHRQARRDGLTGLRNRRALQEDLDHALSNLAPGDHLGVAILDLDDFKALNDAHGHLVGDRVLSEVATSVADHLRPTDQAYRFGGEEFSVLFRHVKPEHLPAIVDRLREAVANLHIHGLPQVTTSIGFAVAPRDGFTRPALLTAADRAMYRSKATGKDRTTAYSGGHSMLGSRAGVVAAESALAVIAMTDPDLARRLRTTGAVARRLALAHGLSVGQATQVGTAGLLLDLGMVGLPPVLDIHNADTAEVIAAYRSHPERSAVALDALGLHLLSGWVRDHHERMDGTGFPNQRSASELALEARILAVADRVAQWLDTSTAPPTNFVDRLLADPGEFDPQVVEHVPEALVTALV